MIGLRLKTGRLIPVLALIGAGLFAWSGAATAHDKGYTSRLTIEKIDRKNAQRGEQTHRVVYKGRLFSDLNTCIVGRRVKLIRAGGANAFSTTIHTRDEGRYRFSLLVEGRGHEFYAKVKRVETPGPHEHVCRADRTRTL